MLEHEVTLPARVPADFHEPTAPLTLVLGDDRIALGGELREIQEHSHASAAVIVGLDAPLRVSADRVHVTRAALVSPGVDHAVEVRGRIAVFLLPVDHIARAELPPIGELGGISAWRELGEAVSRDELDDFALVDRAVARGVHGAEPLDDRLRRALATVASELDENLPVEVVADAAGLSPSRLMALVRAQLGTSLRGYRRWLRTFEVARRYAAGASLTQAAFDAGFASSAHLVTAARASFGVRPSQVLSPSSRGAIRVIGQPPEVSR